MKSKEDVIKPIKIFGAVLILFALFGFYFFTYLDLTYESSFKPNSPSLYGRFGFYFMIAVNLFYLLAGIGVLLLTKWGYILFKLFLYILLIGIPIGTIISYITLSYMKRHKIKQYFGFVLPSTS